MKTKREYFTTVYTKKNEVLLVTQFAGSVVETYCKGYSAKNKKIRMPKFDGYYFNSELTRV